MRRERTKGNGDDVLPMLPLFQGDLAAVAAAAALSRSSWRSSSMSTPQMTLLPSQLPMRPLSQGILGAFVPTAAPSRSNW